MSIQRFEQLIAWQKAQDLAVVIYSDFSKSRDYPFRDQVCRASVSISNNIAEGFGRKGNKEFCRFLYIAISSCGEVRSMIYLAERFSYIDKKKREILTNQCDEVSRLIRAFINSIS